MCGSLGTRQHQIGGFDFFLTGLKERQGAEGGVGGVHLPHEPLLLALLDALLLLVLAWTLAMELVREITEGLLGLEGAPLVIHIVQLHVGAEALLLAELTGGTGVAALAPVKLVIVPATLLVLYN